MCIYGAETFWENKKKVGVIFLIFNFLNFVSYYKRKLSFQGSRTQKIEENRFSGFNAII